tara:strand:+ start:1009 stop:1347 length:339 start_codon:yes stop_codon:yes gene_type:complete
MADPRDEIRVRYPKTLKEFETIQKEMLYLFCEKQLDYGPTNIGLGNSKVEKDSDIQLSLIGLGTRLNDKISRFLNLTMNNKKPKNESIDDTLIDIANYAVMALIVRSKLWGK